MNSLHNEGAYTYKFMDLQVLCIQDMKSFSE